MKYFIGLATDDIIEGFGTDGLFEHDGDYFYNTVEFGSNPGGTDDFVIADGCGRSIPLSVDTLDVLIKVLMDIRITAATLEHADEVKECLQDHTCVHTFE